MFFWFFLVFSGFYFGFVFEYFFNIFLNVCIASGYSDSESDVSCI